MFSPLFIEPCNLNMTEYVVLQDIECSYPLGGNYGPAPRWVYYGLLAFATLFHKHIWLSAGAAASCITYGGTAAIHAVLLAAIQGSSAPQLPDGRVTINNTESVWVSARVADQDVDGVFAVVGAGYLAILPLAVSTSAFRTSGARPILLLWSLLMLAGMICGTVNFYAFDQTSSGPFHQYRFCPPDVQDELPIVGMPPQVLHSTWNESVWAFFNSSHRQGKLFCFYPCLASDQFLRSQPDTEVHLFPDPKDDPSSYTLWLVFENMLKGIMPLTVIFGAIIFLFQVLGYLPDSNGSSLSGYSSLCENWKSPSRRWQDSMLLGLQLYSLVLVPLFFVLFIAFMEWSISLGPPSESPNHVGQWGPAVGVALILVAVFVAEYKRLPCCSRRMR